MNAFEDSKMKSLFIDETIELLEQLEETLMELENSKEDKALIDQTFRILHTIKGSSMMIGLEDIGEFAHDLESSLDLIRNGDGIVTSALVSLMLTAGDRLSQMLQRKDVPLIFEPDNKDLASQIQRALSCEEDLASSKKMEESSDEYLYRIRIKLREDIYKSGAKPELVLRDLSELGSCTQVAHVEGIPPFSELNPETCYVSWDVFLSTKAEEVEVKDVFIFIESDNDIEVKKIDSYQSGEIEPPDKLGSILLNRGVISKPDLSTVLEQQKPLGELLTKSGLVEKSEVNSALEEQKVLRKKMETVNQRRGRSRIHVESEKLDKLVDLVGELVTVQAKMNSLPSMVINRDIRSVSEEMENITGSIRELSMSLRMIPIGVTFNRFKRLVRDLSKQLGKEIELEIEGAETQLDANIIEQLVDPLMHLIRNCIDHGIELPEEREAVGKNRSGRICLKALHKGSYVHIEILDDGKGIDEKKILDKAIQKGLISNSVVLSPQEINSFIFAPGFSTASTISDVSGRGVGMDVVKKTIDKLGGEIMLCSEKGKNCSITIQIPLTLSIIKGLLVKVGEDSYVIPLTVVEECMKVRRKEKSEICEAGHVRIRESLYPCIDLRELFNLGKSRDDTEYLVIAENQNSKTGLFVDVIIGEFQAVVKNISNVFKKTSGVSGATILGNGQIAMILDLEGLKHIQKVQKEEFFQQRS